MLGNPIEEAILETEIPSLKVLPANKDLAGAEVELVDVERREFRLRQALESIEGNYQYVIIDCPPSLGLLTLNALTAARSLLVPIQCEYYALEGVTELFDTLARIRRLHNPSLTIEGLLLTMYDERTNLSAAVASDLRDFMGNRFLLPLFREMFAWLRRPATASQSPSTIFIPRERKRTST